MATVGRLVSKFRHVFKYSIVKGRYNTMTTHAFTKNSTVAVIEVKKFIQRCTVAAGASSKHALALADNLTSADFRGHYSHGLNRLGMCCLLNIGYRMPTS